MTRVTTIIQARMGSKRLPRKVLESILGRPSLEHLIERVKRARRVDEIVVATTGKKADDAIVKLANRLKISVFRGSENDVLDRYYKAAKEIGAKAVVRITGDCPLIDPVIVDWVVGYYIQHSKKFDYVSNVHPSSFPDGMDVEVFSFAALAKAWRQATLPSEREHVTPYMWKRPGKFRIGNVRSPRPLPQLRLTLDHPQDLILIRKIFSQLYPRKRYFTLRDVISFLVKNPKLQKINRGIVRNEGLFKSLQKDKLLSSARRSIK